MPGSRIRSSPPSEMRPTAKPPYTKDESQNSGVSAQLTQALANGAPNNNNGGGDDDVKSFGDIFTFDGRTPALIRSWINHLRIKLAAQSRRYPTEQAQLKYAFSRLSGAAFDQVRSYLEEDTGTITFGTLNEFLVNIRAVNDDPDRPRTARRELTKLKMGPTFPMFPLYFAEFRRLVGDMDLNDAAQKYELKNPSIRKTRGLRIKN
jgi:hypothetical protein